MGLKGAEDAGVFRINDEVALVQTVDFFTPIVDDPRLFGRIAAANALSDVYAMGGRPVTAMNIVGFPSGEMEMSVLREILAGGLETMREAEVVLVGGHSVKDGELKYGLSVTGLVRPDRVITNAGARPGDRLVLTKPIGTGIISTAVKGSAAGEQAVAESTASMMRLNRRAAEAMIASGASACTDVTGFGLLGHAAEMAEASGVALAIDVSVVPLLTGARDYAGMGLVPGGTRANREFRKDMVEAGPEITEIDLDLLFDPQTSGGLLISLPEEAARQVAAQLHKEGEECAAVIGEVLAEPAGKIMLRHSSG